MTWISKWAYFFKIKMCNSSIFQWCIMSQIMKTIFWNSIVVTIPKNISIWQMKHFWELILPSRQMCGLLQKGFVLVLLHKSNKHYVVDGFMVGNWGILLLKCAFPSLFWAHKRRSVVAESISPFWTLPVVLHDSQGEVSREAVSIPGHGVCSIFRDKSMPYINI